MRKEKICQKCNGERNYCEKHDTYYCKKCDMWCEMNCGDKTCDYCKDRPNKPSEVSD